MRKRVKNSGPAVASFVGSSESVLIDIPEQLKPKSKSGSFETVSDAAIAEKAAPARDLRDLLPKSEDPADGRVESRDAVKKTGWRKMDVTVDQQVPICKDYHETGYCTYGASCKFMHIRDEVLTAHQLERKLALDAYKKSQENQKKLAEAAPQPEICEICKHFYRSPVVTRCGHKFCSVCAMKRYRTDHTCAVCGAETDGLFNSC